MAGSRANLSEVHLHKRWISSYLTCEDTAQLPEKFPFCDYPLRLKASGPGSMRPKLRFNVWIGVQSKRSPIQNRRNYKGHGCIPFSFRYIPWNMYLFQLQCKRSFQNRWYSHIHNFFKLEIKTKCGYDDLCVIYENGSIPVLSSSRD